MSRYSRQEILTEIGPHGQGMLGDAHVAVIGLGGLGSAAALYLAGAGIGQLSLVDGDRVELSNLQRQIVHNETRIGENKARSAAQQLGALNSSTQIEVIEQRADDAALSTLASACDVLLDCSDNFPTRHAINRACVSQRTALVSGAAIRWEGQITVFDRKNPDSPCYRCLYASGDDAALTCSENGVIAPLVGIIGTCQALEAIKHVIGTGETLVGEVLYFDAKYMDWRKLKLSKRPGCELCGGADNP